MREAPTVSSWSRYAARTEGLIRKTTWLRMVETVENNKVRVYCFCAVRANQASSWSAPRTRSRVPRTITEIGLFSTKRANTLPSMVASSRESVSKAWSVTKREREDHLNRAGLLELTPERLHAEVVVLGHTPEKPNPGRAMTLDIQDGRVI